MADPSFVLYHVKLLNLDIWHDEPGGHDAGEVCGWPPNRGLDRLTWNARWRAENRLKNVDKQEEEEEEARA